MTLARIYTEYEEVVVNPTTKARIYTDYIEAVAMPTTKARMFTSYMEVVIGTGQPSVPPAGDWAIGNKFP